MSLPIEATPTLRGKDALDFVKRMRKNDKAKLSKSDKELMKEARKITNYAKLFDGKTDKRMTKIALGLTPLLEKQGFSVYMCALKKEFSKKGFYKFLLDREWDKK